MAEREWFIQQQTGHQGPFSAEEVYRHFHEGRIRPESLLWKEGLRDWMPLKNCREIAHALDFNLRSEKLPRPFPPDALDILKENAANKIAKQGHIRQTRPQLHPVDELPPLPTAPLTSKGRSKFSDHEMPFDEWDQIARNFTPNPALEKLRPEVRNFDVELERPVLPKEREEKKAVHVPEEFQELSAPPFSSEVETLTLWEEKSAQEVLDVEDQANLPPTEIKQGKTNWLVITFLVVGVILSALAKIPALRFWGGGANPVAASSVRALQQDFARLDKNKQARFEKVFSNTNMEKSRFNLAMSEDAEKIWLGLSARAPYRFEMEFQSVPDRVMGGKPIQFSAVGNVSDGLTVIPIQDVHFEQGTKIEPGLYEVNFRASRSDNVARWLKILNRNSYGMSLVNSLASAIYPLDIEFRTEKILLSPGDEKEAAAQIGAYLAQVKENKRRPLVEQQQNLLTLQSLLKKMEELMSEHRGLGAAGKTSYIRTYAKQISPALQVLAVPAPKIQVSDAAEGDPDLMVPGPKIWSANDTVDMAKKLALVSAQFAESLTPKKKKVQSSDVEKIIEDLGSQLSAKVELVDQELSVIK